MKSLFFAFFFLIAISYGCATHSTSDKTGDNNRTRAMTDTLALQAAPDTTPLTGRWNLIPAMASDTTAGKLPFLSFADGNVNGSTGCNSFRGRYSQSGINLSFDSNLVTTRMACPGYDENAFVKNLLRTTGYSRKGDTLILQEDMTPISYWLKGK